MEHARPRRAGVLLHPCAGPEIHVVPHPHRGSPGHLPVAGRRQQGHRPLPRCPGSRALRRDVGVRGTGRRRRLTGQRGHGRRPAAGVLRRTVPHRRHRRDVRHVLPACPIHARRQHRRPRLVRVDRLVQVRPNLAEGGRQRRSEDHLRAERLRLRLHATRGGRYGHPVRTGRRGHLRQQPRQAHPRQDLPGLRPRHRQRHHQHPGTGQGDTEIGRRLVSADHRPDRPRARGRLPSVLLHLSLPRRRQPRHHRTAAARTGAGSPAGTRRESGPVGGPTAM